MLVSMHLLYEQDVVASPPPHILPIFAEKGQHNMKILCLQYKYLFMVTYHVNKQGTKTKA